MNELVSAARTAREKLSSALAALQSPQAGNLADTLAEPVAMAMSALHQIETSNGATVGVNGPNALASVRRALEVLQTAPLDNPVISEATASVAGSLSLVHQLAQNGPAQPAAAAQAAVTAPVANVATSGTTEVVAPAPVAVVAAEAATDPLAQTYLAGSSPAVTSPSPVAEPPPVAAPFEPPLAGQPSAAQSTSVESPRMPSAPPQRPPGALLVEAALGAHSATNFYKGLSGNDVIDDGGIFIATYQIPQIGQDLWIKVSLPGGYEFEARGEVTWTREFGTSDSPPGFGAQFREISSESRQLVYRYVRNREPLFHDDL